MICHFVLRYLGKEGLVPAMYLKKLGNDRRKSLGARRKSRLFSSNELRGESDEEDEDIPSKKISRLLCCWVLLEMTYLLHHRETILILLQNRQTLNCCKTSKEG